MNARDVDLIARIERLEKKNRLLGGLCLLCLVAPVLALTGAKTAPQSAPALDYMRVKRLEVVDDRGVPLVTIGQDRVGQGGSVVLRDGLGERRSWWLVGKENAAFTLTSDGTGEGPNSTLGMSVSAQDSQLSLISPRGAQFSASIQKDQPRIELWGHQGQSLFGAPWKP